MAKRVAGMLVAVMAGTALLWAAESEDKKKSKDAEKPAERSESSKDAEEKTSAEKKALPDRRAEEEDAEQASPDEQAIRKMVRQVEEAFNNHDAAALTAFFCEHGEIINAGGDVTQGNDAIKDAFTQIFENNPETQMSIQIESIRVLGKSVAIEEGLTRITSEPGQPEEIRRYTVVYSKEDDKWKMISARDLPSNAPVNDELNQLAWLIGDWVDECDDSIVSTSYRWSANDRYIVGEFHADTPEGGSLDGTVHIGWDPQLKQLRSWVFDSEGGFATGLWARNEDTWIVKLSGVLTDGRTTTSTYRMKRISSDYAEMESRDRVIGGVLIDDAEPIAMVRRGPAPESFSDAGTTPEPSK